MEYQEYIRSIYYNKKDDPRMNPTPQELWVAFADAIQQTVDKGGIHKSISPKQEPISNKELVELRQRVTKLFDEWYEEVGYGTSK